MQLRKPSHWLFSGKSKNTHLKWFNGEYVAYLPISHYANNWHRWIFWLNRSHVVLSHLVSCPWAKFHFYLNKIYTPGHKNTSWRMRTAWRTTLRNLCLWLNYTWEGKTTCGMPPKNLHQAYLSYRLQKTLPENVILNHGYQNLRKSGLFTARTLSVFWEHYLKNL